MHRNFFPILILYLGSWLAWQMAGAAFFFLRELVFEQKGLTLAAATAFNAHFQGPFSMIANLLAFGLAFKHLVPKIDPNPSAMEKIFLVLIFILMIALTFLITLTLKEISPPMKILQG